jgi:hypothetical protein
MNKISSLRTLLGAPVASLILFVALGVSSHSLARAGGLKDLKTLIGLSVLRNIHDQVGDPFNSNLVLSWLQKSGVSLPMELVDYILSQTRETRVTTTGAVFTRVVGEFFELGEAWADPSGLIWGDVVVQDNGSFFRMSASVASRYCASIDARLPTKEEFIRLRNWMGAQPGTFLGYSPQILPHLSGTWFWSSSVTPGLPYSADYFDGNQGKVGFGYYVTLSSVRCVRDADA